MYTAPAGKLVEGRIYITNQTSSEIKFRVGLSTGTASDFDVTRGYVVFDRMLALAEYFESDTIYFADGESAIVRADHTSVTFTLLGTETEDRENAGFLAQGFSEMNGKKSTLLFTVPTDYKQFREVICLFVIEGPSIPRLELVLEQLQQIILSTIIL